MAGVREQRLVTISRVWLNRPDEAATIGEPSDLMNPEGGRPVPEELTAFTESSRLARALEGGSFSLLQESDDPVVPRLAGVGLRGAAGAGGYDADCRQWLAVLMLGADSEPAGTVQLALTAGTQAALGYPRPPRGA